MPGGFEPLHAILALTRRPMRVFTPVIEITTLTVFHPGQYLTLGRAIALQFVRNDDARNVCEALEQLAKKLLRRVLIAPALHQDIENVVVLIDGAPQVMPLTIHCQKHFVQVPLVARPSAPVTELIGVGLPKFPTPFADSLVRHDDAAFEQEFFHVAVAQGEAIVEPDAMTDNFPGKAVVLVTLGVGRRGHVWLPILGCNGSGRDIVRGKYVMAQAGWSTS